MLFNKKNDDAMDDRTASRAGAVPVAPAHLQPAIRKGQNRSIIDPGLIITGTVEGDGELQIDGQVHGDIRCTHLTVGNAASIAGNIAAEEIVVRGRVKGAIAGNRVLLADGAHVESNIFHKRLSIEEGAHFEGAVCPKDDPFNEFHAITAQAAAAQASKSRPPDRERDSADVAATSAAAQHAHMSAEMGDEPLAEAPSARKTAPARAPRPSGRAAEIEGGIEHAAPAVSADDDSAFDANAGPMPGKQASRARTDMERLRARMRD